MGRLCEDWWTHIDLDRLGHHRATYMGGRIRKGEGLECGEGRFK